jgi:hypothetical protein
MLKKTTMKLKSKILIFSAVFFCILCIYSFNKIQIVFTGKSHLKLEYPKNLFSHALNTTIQEDDYIAIVTSYTVGTLNRDSSYSIQAFAKISDNGVPINAGQLSIGSTVINAGPDNLYKYTYSLPTGKALFGSSVNVQINPLSAPQQRLLGNKIIVVPKEIFPSTMSLPKSNVDRTNNYNLNWAPDPNNQFQKVQIQVSYYKGISQYNAAGMPNSINDLVYTVTDNGSFVIPQADLARYPKGCYIGISISRAWLDNTSGNIAYVAITEAHTVPLLVIEPETSSSITINGPESVCTSSVFSVSGIPPGLSSAWSASPEGIVQLSCTNCTQTTVTKYSAGKVTLSATIGNKIVTKQITVGSPKPGPVTFSLIDPTTGKLFANTQPVAGATSYNWYMNGTLNTGWTGPSAHFSIPRNQCDIEYDISVAAVSSCGISAQSHANAYVPCDNFFVVSPNPASSTVAIYPDESKSLQGSQEKSIDVIRIYDNLGNLKKYQTFNKAKTASINISYLLPGYYFIEISNGTFKERKQLIIVK